MSVPVLNLNLAPRPSLWRQQHLLLGWAALGLGLAVLMGSLGFTWRAYNQANRAGRDAVSLTEEAQRAARQEQKIQASLQDIDAGREQSRWKLAERILQERSLPWSRLSTELEQSMVPNMRLKALQRVRSSGQQVVMKVRGEANTREAEAAFIEVLRATPVFAQVVLEREAERPGGGWDFEISLPAAAIPPPFRAKVMQAGIAAAPTSRVAIPMPAARLQPVAAAPTTRPVTTAQPPTPVRTAPPAQPPSPAAQPAEEETPRPARRVRPNVREKGTPQ